MKNDMKIEGMRVIFTAFLDEKGNIADMDAFWQIHPYGAVATPEIRKQFREAVSKMVFSEGLTADDDGKTTLVQEASGATRRIERLTDET